MRRAAVIMTAALLGLAGAAAEAGLRSPGLGGPGGGGAPPQPLARLLVLDAATGRPVVRGSLRWTAPGIPDELASAPWAAPGGRLEIGCRGGEPVELAADGYRALELTLEPQARRLTVLLEPAGDLELRLEPAGAGRLWLAAESAVSAIAPFHAAAAEHLVGADGTVVVRDLEAAETYRGVVVVPGRAPLVGRFQGLPRRLALGLEPGLGLSGRVLDADERPLGRARVTATGRIDELDGFRYRQQAETDAEGRFTLAGLLAGGVEVEACAALHACATATVEVASGGAAPLAFRLEPGFDLRLLIRDEAGRPAAGAAVFDGEGFRRRLADDEGALVFEGVRPGDELALEVRGAGLRPWQGRVVADRAEVVLRIAAGAVVEWPILTGREVAADEVRGWWSRLNRQGREIAEGEAMWDPERGLVRATGLEPGPHRLVVQLPGAATLISEVVEVGLGDEVALPAALPDRGLAVSGRVLDGASLAPVAGARVSCEPGSPHEFRKPVRLERLPEALSDADGVFLLEGLDPGRCRAVVRAPGFAAWRRDGVEPEESGTDLGDVELGPGMTIVGRVVDRSGRPQTGVAVEIAEDAAYAYVAETTLTTDHDGFFRAAALPAGRWAATARRGEEEARAKVEGEAGETVETELRLGGQRLEGEVWIGDRPAAGGHLVLTTDGARGEGIVVMVRTDVDKRRLFGVDRPPLTIVVAGDGRFAADGVTPGVYTASYTPPGAAASPVSRELVVPVTEIHRCVVQFPDAGLEGVVVDPEGRPVAGAAVWVLADDNRPVGNGFSDGEGGFAFLGLDAGAARVTAVHGEYGDAEPVRVELEAGRSVGPVTVELRPPEGAELALVVRSAGGSLAGAPVYLVGAETLTGFTDDLGGAGFVGVAAGRYRPCAAAYGGATGCGPELELADGERREVVLDLGRGGLVEVLLGPMERSPALRVTTADGIDLTSLLQMVSPPLPGPEGVRLGPLRADSYRITVASPAGPREGATTAREGETTTLDLR